MKRFLCVICGKEETPSRWTSDLAARLVEHQNCFSCSFWLDHASRKDNPCSVRINGRHYFIGDEGYTGRFRGFRGRKFLINFIDGRKVTTTNLWPQGTIPDHFRNLLPDNASFGGPE